MEKRGYVVTLNKPRWGPDGGYGKRYDITGVAKRGKTVHKKHFITKYDRRIAPTEW